MISILLFYVVAPVSLYLSNLYINSYTKNIYQNTIKSLLQYVKINNINLLPNMISVKITGNKEYIIDISKKILNLKIYCKDFKLIKKNNKYILTLDLIPYAINNLKQNVKKPSNVICIRI